ncbi:UDP-N-acetylglucosamine--N-acetylmuramyl-(pentapeptide) pyrophosphoryl-undecaprenol N-acetylglucosamine transferase [Bacterioplanes sanyensis]|uniref:undecaprenyldiphospho-muramoylpentapeptide beta-N-acetylglucosaminyltransferase n=1 Tax=Bacterioplanes sanyensis TaxID=1249553 RepID=UPI0016752351|nr:undecaprenyldiphospho-muramoylpentapeptide beta-N-acetylglucosaminyltransferase [Bacterioplanes sanyensis]GGY37822.1 UDP-N-acetylglucosamine--N-acetylmuramyl-(pentapeptide) pyrophosphoryl-undecaprenol N-acetylglucosamine transferase [Bacterioplanes sanyensis]
MADCIVISAAGTGGHVIPALSVAQELKQRGYEVHWLGTPHGIEQQLVPKAGIPLHSITIRGLRGNGWRGLLAAPWRVLKATWQAWKIIRALNPVALVGFGGYVTGPAGMAARLAGCRLAIHEQNALPGMTNKYLRPLAHAVLQAFDGALPGALTTGNPVRAEFNTIAPPTNEHTALNVLVVGGSLGALALNQVVLGAMQALPVNERPNLVHQVGKKHLADMQAQYQQAGVEAEVRDFIDDMPAAFAQADLIICRAGALTVSEVAAAGRAAIFVPFPYAVDDHQTSNANALVQRDAAELIQQSQLTPQWLQQRWRFYQQQRPALQQMAKRARQCAVPDATARVVQHLETMIRG